MANMSYCRFHNTLMDMDDCFEAVRNRYYSDDEYAVSDEECRKFKQMVFQMVEFLGELELIDEEGCVDEDSLEKVINRMKEGEE